MSEYRIGWLPRYVWITTLKPAEKREWAGGRPVLSMRARHPPHPRRLRQALPARRGQRVMTTPEQRLEAIRASLRAEDVSYGELAELQDLTPHIGAGDTELLEAAGVPEDDGTSGQDRESYTDDQDRESYTVRDEWLSRPGRDVSRDSDDDGGMTAGMRF